MKKNVQSEEIAERTETIIQDTNSNTSKQEVDKNKKVVIPEPETTTEINQPNAVTAPKVNSVDKIRSSNNLQRTALNVNKDAGKDVSEKVEVIKRAITTKDKSKKVNPHQAGRITVDYELIIGDDIKKDDYFDIKFSENVDTNGVGSYKEMPEIKDGGHVIATSIRMSNGDVRYKFTEYVIGTEYVKVKLSINLFFKTSVVLKGSKQKVTSTIGDNSIDNEFDVEYLKEKKDKNMSINGNIDKLDKENGNITHVTSVNTDSKNLNHVVITGKLSVGEVSKNNIPKITIYEYTGSGALSESGYFNEKDGNFKDVTALVNAANVISLNENGSFTIFIQSLNSKPYIIKYEAKYDIKSQNLNFQTQMCINYDLNWLTLNNEVEFYKNSASGAGKFIPIIDGGRVVDITTDSPIIVKGENNVDFEFEIEETIVESIIGNNNDGILEIIEDSKPDVITGENSTDEIIEIEDSNPGGGKVDYNTNIIDIDEDSNFGEEDIYHNTDIIDFDEDTATGVVTGAISDHTTIEDTMEYTKDNNLIELVDDNTLPPAITGEAEGPIIEIDENHKVEIIDITMPIGEEGRIKGKIEETVENNVIDFDTESGSGTIHGNITGIVEEIDDNHVIDIEHGLDSENGSIDINDTVEDTMIDKPSIDNRTENPVIIVENTIPKNNGSVKGIIEELDITKVVSPVIVQKDKKNMPQATKNENVGVEKKARIGNVASQKNKDLIIKDERKIKYNSNSQGCDSGRACVVNVKPNFEPISTVPHTSNDSETQLETLPNTGQNNNEQAVVFGGLLSLLGLSLLRRKGKKTIE
ncbi:MULTISPECIES: fibrinogen-binding adhesin SdrG C-terminal domain-containing protein [Staphylococcus]|nr:MULTISPECIES: fibrinogen-binding adhesin SdrG C-terminal domain-containing protein [Staphylococcus]NHM91283.1 LPXTG cell wall anchor domain-containing protein [Staphylococcus sp. 10602379]UOC12455.1 fibrinogen-binding adhesin SdrG C-terminal domain-containing protein [Staphylococcus agnetis]